MIELNFIESSDPAILGPYRTFKDHILIGAAHKNDIIIQDSSLFKIHFNIQISKDGLICWNEQEDGDYLSNDKLYKGRKIHKQNDKIKIGETLFEIINFALEEKEDLNKIIKDSYESTLEHYPAQEKVIDELENELSHLEELSNN